MCGRNQALKKSTGIKKSSCFWVEGKQQCTLRVIKGFKLQNIQVKVSLETSGQDISRSRTAISYPERANGKTKVNFRVTCCLLYKRSLQKGINRFY